MFSVQVSGSAWNPKHAVPMQFHTSRAAGLEIGLFDKERNVCLFPYALCLMPIPLSLVHQDLQYIRYFRIVAFVCYKGFHGLDPVDFGYLLRVELEKLKLLIQENDQYQVKLARYDVYRYHTF